MSVLVSKPAPDFVAKAVMPDNSIIELRLSEYTKGKYVVLFFYPLDFTFVCPSEIIAFDKRLEEFKRRNAEVISVSVDSHFSHIAYKKTPINEGGIGQVRFPMVADLSKQISRDYDVLFDNSVALRGTFIIDPKGIVRHQLINDLPIGRSIDEALRILDALRHNEEHGEVCPSDWQHGKEAMKASAEGVASYLKKHG